MMDNIYKFTIKLLYILSSKFPTLISVMFSFILENKINIAKYIPILEEYGHELNIAVYTIIISKLITLLRNYLNKYIVNIECYFYENKHHAEKERVNDVIELKIAESSNRIYLGIKFSGYYKELKNYYLEIKFPTWIDLNDFSGTSLLRLDEKELTRGVIITNIIVDFSSIDIDGDSYKDGSRLLPLDFILNSLDNTGCKESIEIRIKAKKKLKLYDFKSNQLKIFSDL